MQRKRIFWTNPILLLCGRLLCFLFLGVTMAVYVAIIREVITAGTVSEWGWALTVIFLLTASSAFIFYQFWPSSFGRLILTEDAVIWRCPFLHSRKIAKDACSYVGIKEAMVEQKKGKWVSTGLPWVYFSTQPFPVKKNISQLRTRKNFIKFPLSFSLCQSLGEWLPSPVNLTFKSRAEKELREKKRRREKRLRRRLKGKN